MRPDEAISTAEANALPATLRGPWNATASGGAWSILRPSAQDVRFDDIANGLSRICRFNGQIREDLDFFAVTEHSAIMTEWALENGVARSAEDAIAILLHDGSEGYFGDMTTEIKKVLPEYRKLEKATQARINESFGLNGARVMISASTIKRIDQRMFIAEAEQVLLDPANNTLVRKIHQEFPDLEPLDITLDCLSPKASRQRFVSTFMDVIDSVPARDPEWKDSISEHVANAREMQSRLQPRSLSIAI